MERNAQSQWNSRDVARLLALVEKDRRFYQDVLASMPVALAVLDEDRTIVSFNRAFRTLFDNARPARAKVDRAAEAISGRRIEEVLVTEAERVKIVEGIRNLRVHGIAARDLSIDLWGDVCSVSLITLPDWDDDAGRQTLLVIHRGGGEREPDAAQPASQGTSVSLPHNPVAGSAPKDEDSGSVEQLKLSGLQQIAAGRSAALQGFAARLAHDLNNPLMIISGYAEEMLGAIPADDPHRADAEQILGATERIANITSQLLEFTRKQARPARPVEIASFLRSMVPQIVEKAGPQVSLKIAPGNPLWAAADPDQLRDVLLALASSAREDARRRTNLRITFGSVRIDESSAGFGPGHYARIALHDNGKGYDPERSSGVFESILSKEKDHGAGPALALAYRLVREWGGDIVYTGEPSLGTTFVVYLPVAEPLASETPATSESSRSPAEPPRPTVLVVDDEGDIRSLVAKILRREKYDVLEAGSVSEALAAASEHRGSLDLLVSDVMLPDRSGRELAEQLREALPSLKVLYISGYTEDESVRLGTRPTGAKFLQKPFTLGALLGKVREALQ